MGNTLPQCVQRWVTLFLGVYNGGCTPLPCSPWWVYTSSLLTRVVIPAVVDHGGLFPLLLIMVGTLPSCSHGGYTPLLLPWWFIPVVDPEVGGLFPLLILRWVSSSCPWWVSFLLPMVGVIPVPDVIPGCVIPVPDVIPGCVRTSPLCQ